MREQYSDAEIDIYYIDIRAHGKNDAFYNRNKADPQVRFVKSKPGHIDDDANGDPMVCGEDTFSRDMYANSYDLVVLATGMEPTTLEDYQPPVKLTTDAYGFVVPELGDGDGMYGAGVATGPFDVNTSVQSATAAALKALQAVRASA